MSQQELLTLVIGTLDRLGIPCMLTGSMVSSLQGEPRATHDVDLLVDLPADKIEAVIAAFASPDFYLSRQAMHDAVQNRRMFNLLELTTGDKVDFWILTDDPFDLSRFARRKNASLSGIRVDISTPEDTILMKLKWAKAAGGSEKQFRDAVRVFEVQSPQLELDYIQCWVQRLNVADLWERLIAEAESLD